MYFANPTSSKLQNGIRTQAGSSGALHTRSEEHDRVVTLTWVLNYDNMWRGTLTNDINNSQICSQTFPGLPQDLFAQGAYIALRPVGSLPIEVTIIDKKVHIMTKDLNEYPGFESWYTPERFVAEQLPGGRTFYLSRAGYASDQNDGMTEETPWKTFDHLMETVTLQGGDSVLLERGSIFTEELYFTVSGAPGNVIRIGAYGEGDRPVIAEPEDPPHTQRSIYAGIPVIEEGWKGLTLISCSNWKISDIAFRGGKTGIFLKNSYQNNAYDPSYHPHQNIEIASCEFIDLRNDTETSPGYYYFTEEDSYSAYSSRIADPRYDSVYGSKEDRIFWYGGIFLGQYGVDNPEYIHENFYIHDCTFTDCDSGFGAAWYYSSSLAPYLKNLVMENCSGTGMLQGIFMLNHVSGALIKDVHLLSGGGFSSSGIAGAFLERCSDVIIDSCTFSHIERTRGPFDTPCHDGVGLDFEGVCERILIQDSLFSHNDGAAILICNTAPSQTFPSGSPITTRPNADIHLESCTFIANAANPDSVDFPDRDTAYEIMCWQPNSSGHIKETSFAATGLENLFSPLMQQQWNLYGALEVRD